MNDKDFKAQQKRVLAMCKFWRQETGLGYWKITYKWCRESIPDHEEAAGVCKCDWMYQHATIFFNLDQLKDMDDEDAEKIVIHEHMHIFLNETRYFNEENGIKHEERVASALTSAFWWVRKAGQKEGAKAERKAKSNPKETHWLDGMAGIAQGGTAE